MSDDKDTEGGRTRDSVPKTNTWTSNSLDSNMLMIYRIEEIVKRSDG